MLEYRQQNGKCRNVSTQRPAGVRISLACLLPATVIFTGMFVCYANIFAAGGIFTPRDRDYFTASEDFETLRDLALIDEARTDHVMHWLRTDNLNRAIQDLKFTLDRFPNHPRALLLFEVVGKVAQVPTMAIPYYEKALSLYPQYASSWAQYGKYLVDIGKREEGIEMLKKAIEIDPNFPPAHGWLSDAYMKDGKPDLARVESEKAKSLGFKAAPSQPQSDPGRK